jgi:Domain of unknown function (DUF4136)
MVTCVGRTIGALALVGLTACASRPNVTDLTSGPIVATKFDPAVDFGSFATFAINPTVSLTTDLGDAGGTLPPDNAASVVDAITANMSARGYQRVGITERPALGLQATVSLQLNTATVGSAGSWWGAPGYGSTPAFWGFPSSFYYAPWSYSTIAYKAGTLIIEAVDLRDPGVGLTVPDASVGPPASDAGDGGTAFRLEVVWAAYMHAVTQELLSSFGPDTQAAINQAFLQSPYLQRQETAVP